MSNNGTISHQNPFKGYEEGKTIKYFGLTMLTGMMSYGLGFMFLVFAAASKFGPNQGAVGSVGMAITGAILFAIGIFFHFLANKTTNYKYAVIRNYHNEDGTLASELRNSDGVTKVVEHGTTTSFWKSLLILVKQMSLRDLLSPKLSIFYVAIVLILWAS
jgi:hypothetical protein